jgi:hypothetical protein
VAIVLIEGFDWCSTGSAGPTTDLAARYNIAAGNTPGGVDPPGRFGGNAYHCGGNQALALQLHNGPFGPRIVMGFAYLNQGVSGVAPIIRFFDGDPNGAGTLQCQIAIENSSQLRAYGQVNPLGAPGPTVLAFNTYYYIEVDILIGGAGAGTFACNLEGGVQFALVAVQTQFSGAAQFSHVQLFGTKLGFSTFFDDLYVKTTAGYLGPSRVTLKTPTSDGALTQWTPSPVQAHFLNVNNIPPDADTTFNSDATAGDIDLYGFSALGQNPASIFGVQVSLYARKDDAAARSIATMVRSGGANFTGLTQVITTTYLDSYLQVYETDPNTAAAWTVGGLDAAQFGVKTIS